MTIDELFDALSSADDTIRSSAIKAAKNTKYISVFFQPIESKAVWESCAIIIAARPNYELERYKYHMFRWLQDLDWPGASIIFDKLLDFPFATIQSEFSFCVNTALQTNDRPWLGALCEFSKRHSEELYSVYCAVMSQDNMI